MKPTTPASLGNISLAVSIGGFVATETALRYGLVAGAGWKVLQQAFEAATIGGCADWFAVSALFREVPVPLIRRHTNIIVKNRRRIVEGIADMVQNRWLAPRVIREHLAHFSASQTVLDYLSDSEHRENVLVVIRDVLQKIARGIDRPEVAAFLERVIKDQLRDLQLAEHFGLWLGQFVRRGDHDAVWETLLGTVEKAIREPAVKKALQGLIESALDEYKTSSFLRHLGFKMARKLLNKENLAAAFIAKLAETIAAIRSDRGHPVRSRVDAFVIEFADQLAAGTMDAASLFETVRFAFVEGTDLGEILQRSLRRLGDTIEKEFEKVDSDLNRLMRQVFQERLDLFRANRAAQEKLDAWLRNVASELVEKRHDMIGEIVRGSLEKLSDLDLVGQIENRVGQDLQYIRLNGAIVGGFAGAVIAIIKLLL